ncbi:MAG: polysaccharide deacetylase family protein [Sphingobacteriales bacterium]|nr:polysaccharide deacetylase family protein [Sphingobacteriales bacterium]
MYFVRTPYIIQKLFSGIIWNFSDVTNKVYLTFDDGPHPEITPWILALLKNYQAKATFFCLGKNAEKYPGLITQILNEGHGIGNHTHTHLNGWRTTNEDYLQDIENANRTVKSSLFRPPYGRITLAQLTQLSSSYKVINWSLMPGDFDESITSVQCLHNLQKAQGGDIIVLHENDKSRVHLEYSLPLFLESNNRFIFDKINF